MFYEAIDNVNKVNKQEQFVPAKGMILGHSPQFMYNKPLNSDLNKRIWRVDVGVSRAFGKRDGLPNNRRIQILEILNDETLMFCLESLKEQAKIFLNQN